MDEQRKKSERLDSEGEVAHGHAVQKRTLDVMDPAHWTDVRIVVDRLHLGRDRRRREKLERQANGELEGIE